jgi:mycothiol synthase
VTTVVKRLYFARQRLKERMFEMFKDELQTHRPSRNKAFAEEVQARLRPFAEADWDPVATLAYGLEPNLRADDEVWLRNRRQFDETRYVRRQYVAEHADSGQLLGYGSIEQTNFLPKYRLFLLIDPIWLRAGVGDLLLDQLMTDLRAANAIAVWHRNFVEQADILSFLEERGFVETARIWDLRWDIERADTSIFQPILKQVEELGIEITTFTAELERDPECLRRLHEFLNSVKADDPHRQPYTPAPFESAEKWCASSAFVPDACFIAKCGEKYVGFTDLIRLELISGGVTQGFTGVAREFRRKGVATALKLRALEYARARGLKTIRALVYPSQEQVMSLNQKLGFHPAFCYVTVERFLRETATVEPGNYEKYVGEYKPSAESLRKWGMPDDLTVRIKLVGNQLISEVQDMQDELFPESETVFFIKAHYGQIEFVEEPEAQVTHLIYREHGMEVRADRIA